MGVVTSITLLQPYALSLGVPVAAMGVIVIGIRGITMAASWWADRIAKKVGQEAMLIGFPVMMITNLVFLGLTHSLWGIFFISMMTFGNAAIHPLLEYLIQEKPPGDIRATLISIQSLLFTLFLASIQPIIGFLGDRYGLSASFLHLH